MTLRPAFGRGRPPLGGPLGALVATELPGSRAARERSGRASGAAAPCARFAAPSFVAAFAVVGGEPFAVRVAARRSPASFTGWNAGACHVLAASPGRVNYQPSVGGTSSARLVGGASPANSSARRPFAPRPTLGRVPRPPRYRAAR